MWEEESTWGLQFRCKICADAPGAILPPLTSGQAPSASGEDAGFNGIQERLAAGKITEPPARPEAL